MNTPIAPDRWQRINDLFLEAADLPPARRAAWLDQQCAGDAELRREVESLLESDVARESAVSFSGVVNAAIADAASAAGTGMPEAIGRYRLLREIGHGGMGTVFLAERADDEFHHRVAIKLVRGVLGGEGVRRFRAERQILASLEHASIARLHDGGTTPDGLPYLVMEYVDGVPIDDYCAARALTIRERLELFCRVCDAVSYAHRNLVVHRDLKPSNILVAADGTPKLLDFGIAKLLDDTPGAVSTSSGIRAMTPEYASPEQVRGEAITTAADVYSLGVLLFELLTGERPLAITSGQAAEIERVICDTEPRRPSAVVTDRRAARELAGDLDTIVLKALLKESAHRYASAAHLAEDIRRHLDGRLVVARPATWTYRTNRFVRRHRAAVAGGTLATVMVVGFVIALGVQARRTARERDAAEQVSSLMMELYRSLDPSESRGAMVTSRESLDRGAERIRTQLRGQPELQARMLDSIGTVYNAVGLPDRAMAVLEESLALQRTMGARTLAAAQTMNRLSVAMLGYPGKLAEAEALVQEALEIRRRLAGPRAPETAESLNTLGVLRHYRGRGIDGAPEIAEAIDIWRVTHGADSAEFANGVRNLALTWRERADYLRAERFAPSDLLKVERFERELLASRRKALGDAHSLTGVSLSSLGQVLHFSGRDAEAEPVLRESIEARTKAHGGRERLSVIESIHNLAAVLHDQGRLDEAEPLYREAVDLLRRTEPGHPQLAININNLATLLADRQRWHEADAAYEEAIAIRRQKLGRDHPAVARTLNNHARLMRDRGRPTDALALVDEALAIRRAKLGDADYETATSKVLRGSILAALGRRDEARPLITEGVAVYRKSLPPDDRRIRDAEQMLR